MNWQDILWELVQMIETAAPKAWEIATKQVQVMYYKSLLNGFVWTILGTISSWFVIKVAYGEDHDWENDVVLLFLIFTLIPLVVGILCFSDVIGYSVNPEYYAIKALTNLVNISN